MAKTTAGITLANTYAPPTDNPPVITSTPAPSFTEGVAGQYDMSQHWTDDGVSTVTSSLTNVLPNGLVYNGNTHLLTYDGVAPVTVSQHQLIASDAVGQDTSAVFDITVAAVGALTLDVSAKRYDGASGSAIFTGMIPLQEGQLADTDLGNIAIFDGFTELPIAVNDSDLRHPDGSVKCIKVDTQLTAANEVEVPLTLQFGTTPTAGTITPTTIDVAWMQAPRQLACTEAQHLCDSNVALGPLVPLAELQSQGLTRWYDALKTDWDSISVFPSYGYPIEDFLNGTPSSWPGDDDNAYYSMIYSMYCRYLMSGEIDDLRLANGFLAWDEIDPRNPQEWSHGNAAVVKVSDLTQLGVNFDYPDPPNPGSGNSPAALTEWFNGYCRDVYLGWALSGWRQARGIGLAIGLRMKAERDQYTAGTVNYGRFDFRHIRECSNYVPLYRVDEDLRYQSGAVVPNSPSPVTNFAWWENMYQTQWYDRFEAWATAIDVNDPLGRHGVWGWWNAVLTGYPLFQFFAVFDTIYTLERNVYQDDQGRTWSKLEETANWCLNRTSFPTKYTFQNAPSAGVDTFISAYIASSSIPTSIDAAPDGPYTCSILCPMMAWAYAYCRDTGQTAKADEYLDFIDTMNDMRCWNIRDFGSAGNGFKQIGEMYGMLPHAAAWRAGKRHDD